MGPPGDSSTDSVFLVFNLNLIKSCYGTGNAAHDGRATVAVNGEGPGPQAASAHGLKAELEVAAGATPQRGPAMTTAPVARHWHLPPPVAAILAVTVRHRSTRVTHLCYPGTGAAAGSRR